MTRAPTSILQRFRNFARKYGLLGFCASLVVLVGVSLTLRYLQEKETIKRLAWISSLQEDEKCVDVIIPIRVIDGHVPDDFTLSLMCPDSKQHAKVDVNPSQSFINCKCK